MKITIELDVHDEHTDPDHPTGLTEPATLAILGALAPYGDLGDITREDDDDD